jgi:hypothetical protein
MSTPSLITQLVAALAWPVTVLTCVLLLRPFLARLIPLIKTVKYSDIEIQFGREVADIKATSSASLQARGIKSNQQPIWEDLIRLAAVRPRSAISRAWQQVEGALITRAKDWSLDVAPAVWQMPMVLGATMLNKGEISPEQYDLLGRLRQLVEESRHAPVDTLRPDDAAEFVGLALRFAATLTPAT